MHRKLIMKKTIKIIAWVAGIMAVICIAIIFICNQIVVNNAKGKVFSNIDSIKYNKVGLLLGTTPQARIGRITNYFFIYRIDAAEQLYKAGKIKYILISGDENSLDGINEPECMRDSLVARGVPKRAIILDGKGYRTINSVINANKEYGLKNFTIISQEFHNERALYQAEHLGLDVENIQGFNAKMPKSRRAYLTSIREYFARIKLFLDLLSKEYPIGSNDMKDEESTEHRFLFGVPMEGKSLDGIIISLIDNTDEFDFFDDERDGIWRLKFCGVPFGVNIHYEHRNAKFIVNHLNLFTSQQSIKAFEAIRDGISKRYGVPNIDDYGAGSYEFDGKFYGRCTWSGALLRNVHSDEGGMFLILPSAIEKTYNE